MRGFQVGEERGRESYPQLRKGAAFPGWSPSGMEQDLRQGSLRKVPRDDELKETEGKKNESTEEPPGLEPEKIGHRSSPRVSQAHGIPCGF